MRTRTYDVLRNLDLPVMLLLTVPVTAVNLEGWSARRGECEARV